MQYPGVDIFCSTPSDVTMIAETSYSKNKKTLYMENKMHTKLGNSGANYIISVNYLKHIEHYFIL